MDIYKLGDKNQYLGSIDSLTSIEGVLEVFTSKTGLTIDEYGNTRLHLDHVKLLCALVASPNEWKTMFEKAIKDQDGLWIVGD